MKKDIRSNSLVILAKSHNPTILSDYFLIETGIISDIRELNQNNKIITPAVAQLQFQSGVNFNLDAERLLIAGKVGSEPFEIGQKYCQALGYIKGNAIGINFDVYISDFDFKEWFSKIEKEDYIPNQAKYNKQYGEVQCNITFVRESDVSSMIQYNFHYQLKLEPLKNLKIDFVSEWEINMGRIDESLNKLLS